MEKTTKEILNFKLAMADELLTSLEKTADQMNLILENPKSYDSNYLWHTKQMLSKISYYRAILKCTNEDEFFYLTSGKPEIKEVI